MQNQKKVWNKIAPEWHEFKTKPSEIVVSFLKKQKGKILDFGSGSGRHLMEIKNGKMYLVDFSEEMIKLAEEKKLRNKKSEKIKNKTIEKRFEKENRKLIGEHFTNNKENSRTIRVGRAKRDLGGKEILREFSPEQKIHAEFFVADMTKLPFENDFFDSAICISSLHCIEGEQKRKKAVEELFKILKPKSKVLVGVWNKNSHRFRNAPKEKIISWRNKGERYYYLFDEKEIHKLFKNAGFKIIKTEIPDRMIYFIAKKN